MQIDLLFTIVVLAFSAILHEVAHGYMANYLGDPTARLQGRLTLNPLKHIDPIGTILIPILDLTTHIPFPAWAKPVPYNPYNLPGKYDETLVAFAGPGTNIFLALLFGLAVRSLAHGGVTPQNVQLINAFATIAFVNLLLACFNLIPIPPLDGSKVLSGILPGALGRAYEYFRFTFERFGFLGNILILYILISLFSNYFYSALEWLFMLLTGLRF